MSDADKELVRNCLHGQSTAWTIFYERFAPAIRGTASALVRWRKDKEHAAEELTQLLCYLLVCNPAIMEDFLSKSLPLSTLLRNITSDLARRENQREKRRRHQSLKYAEELPEGTHLDGLDFARLHEFLDRLRPGLRKYLGRNAMANGRNSTEKAPATPAERLAKHRLLAAWRQYDRQD